MKSLRLVFLAFVFFSCSSSGDEEVVRYSDISPNSKHKHHEVKKEDKPANERPVKSVFLAVIDSIRPESSWQKWDSILFPDRFGAGTTEKWIVHSDIDSVLLIHYGFRDSTSAKNAFYNWIDCFGPSCKSYTVGGNIRTKNKYTYFFVGTNDIYFVESQKNIDPVAIRDAISQKKKPVKVNKNENWLYTVVSKPSGKAVWKRVIGGVEQEIKNWNEDSK